MVTDWTNEQVEYAPGLTMPVRVYRGSVAAHRPPLVLHLHGGAFQGGSLEEGHCVARLLAEAGAVAVSADYPTAHPFPDALEAIFATLQRLYDSRAHWAQRGSRLFVAGEEAGGNLAAGLALMARDRQTPPLSGQILVSPMLDPGMGTCSIRNAAAGAGDCKWAEGWHAYLGTSGGFPHPYAAPGGAARLAGVAPALVMTAEDCPMHDESLAYAARLAACGIAVQCLSLPAPTCWPGALSEKPAAAPDWRATARDALAAFFAATVPHRLPA
jgi:acetyl esterase